jgi:hypothetical protein
MRSLLLVVCLPGLTLAEDRPFVRITHPADAAQLIEGADFEVRGSFDYQSVEDPSKFHVQIRLYQASVNRLNLVRDTGVAIAKVEGQSGVYSFQTQLKLPAGNADCVLRAEAFQNVGERKRKWIARDFAIVYPRTSQTEPQPSKAQAAIAGPSGRWVLMGTDLDHAARYVEGATMAVSGGLTLNGTQLAQGHVGRIRLYRVQAGRLVVFQDMTANLKASPEPDVVYFTHDLQPKGARPAGDYLLRLDLIDSKKPDASLLRDATLLEVVPRKEPKPPQSS